MTRSILLAAAVCLLGCGKTAEPDPEPVRNIEDEGKLLPSPVGEPYGALVQQEIGPDGGSLASDDGRFLLTVPAGALQAPTRLSVQSITATAPGAIGVSVRLEKPAGVTFAQPVRLSFKLASFELSGVAVETLSIGSQNAQGFWETSQATLDVPTRTLSMTTSHFSDWSPLAGLQLVPATASVQVGKQLTLRVRQCNRVNAESLKQCIEGTQPPCLVAFCHEFSPGADVVEDWSVNGKAGGDSQIGTVSKLANGTGGTFTAPTKKPEANVVDVSARYPVGQSDFGRNTVLTMVSNVTITDDPEYLAELFFSGNVNGLFSGDGQLAFQRIEDLPDVERYRINRGTFSLNFTYPECDTVTNLVVQADTRGELVVRKSNNKLGKTYFWSATSVPRDVPLRCYDPRMTMVTPILISLNPTQQSYENSKMIIGTAPNMSLGGEVRWLLFKTDR